MDDDTPVAQPEPDPVPTRDWIPHPVSDSAEYLDRPAPRYVGRDDEDEALEAPVDVASGKGAPPVTDSVEADEADSMRLTPSKKADELMREHFASVEPETRDWDVPDTSSTGPLGKGSHHHDADTRELLGVVDRESLVRGLQVAINDAEEAVTDFIAEDYDDDDIDAVGEDVVEWELAVLREADGRLQATCLVGADLYRDDDSDVGTTVGSCWCLVEFAEQSWQDGHLTPSSFWMAKDRDGPVLPWTPAPDSD